MLLKPQDFNHRVAKYPQAVTILSITNYKGVSKSFHTELIMKQTNKQEQQQTLKKQHKGLWWKNSLDWLTK